MIRAAAVQTKPIFGDVAANLEQARQLVERERADLYVLPELFSTGYLFREHVATDWWVAHEQGAALLVQTVLMIVVAVLLTRPILALASRQVLSPWRNMFLAVVFVAVFTSLWPNWREEGRALRLSGTTAAAGAVETDARPHLVLVTIDTWRRDALSAFSPDALTAMEANYRFVGPETMETKIFSRLSAWQNWGFQRPNAVGPEGALRRFGSGSRPAFDQKRV